MNTGSLNTGNALHTVTLASLDILSSAPSTAPLAFSVTSVGSIPAKIHVTQTVPTPPFYSLLAAPADVTLNQSQVQPYSAGLGWPELVNSDLGKVASITYTITAGEVPTAPVLPALGTFQRVGNVVTIYIHTLPGSTVFQPGDTLAWYSAPAGISSFQYLPSVADASGNIYAQWTVPATATVGSVHLVRWYAAGNNGLGSAWESTTLL